MPYITLKPSLSNVRMHLYKFRLILVTYINEIFCNNVSYLDFQIIIQLVNWYYSF